MIVRHSSHPQRDTCSSRGAGSFTEALVLWRDAHHGDGGNKQGTSNSGTQPLTTIINITWIHARSGQPLAVTLNGTVRGLTYKQEAGGSSPSPPIAQSLQMSRLDVSCAGMLPAGNTQLVSRSHESPRNVVGSRRLPASGMSLALPPQCARSGRALLVPSEGVVRLSRDARSSRARSESAARHEAPSRQFATA